MAVIYTDYSKKDTCCGEYLGKKELTGCLLWLVSAGKCL